METSARSLDPFDENKLILWIRCDPQDVRYLFPKLYGDWESLWNANVLPDDYSDWPSAQALEDAAKIAIMQHPNNPDIQERILHRLNRAKSWLEYVSHCEKVARLLGIRQTIRHRDVKSYFEITKSHDVIREFAEPHAPDSEWIHGPEILHRWKIPEVDPLEIVKYEVPICVRDKAGEMVKVNEHLGVKLHIDSYRVQPKTIWLAVPQLWYLRRDLVEFVEKREPELAAIVPDLTTRWMTVDEVFDFLPNLSRHKLTELIEDKRLLPRCLYSSEAELSVGMNYRFGHETLVGCLFERSEVEDFARRHPHYTKNPDRPENPDKKEVRKYAKEKIRKNPTITQAELVEAVQETSRIKWHRKKLYSSATEDFPEKHYSDRKIEEWLREWYDWPQGRPTDKTGPTPKKQKTSH